MSPLSPVGYCLVIPFSNSNAFFRISEMATFVLHVPLLVNMRSFRFVLCLFCVAYSLPSFGTAFALVCV